MDDKLHKAATALAADHWALHMPGLLTIEQQEQLVAEPTSWSPADDHQRPTWLLGGFAPARRLPASTDKTAERPRSALPEWLVEIDRAAHSRTADPSTGLLCQHLTETSRPSG
jgi:hypothetical protein